jgi:Flp pilus assembly pilin Flp
VLFGASFGEIGFVVLLVAVVLLAPIAPRLGEAVGGLFEKRSPPVS